MTVKATCDLERYKCSVTGAFDSRSMFGSRRILPTTLLTTFSVWLKAWFTDLILGVNNNNNNNNVHLYGA